MDERRPWCREWSIPSEWGRERPVVDELAALIGESAGSQARLDEIRTAVTEGCLNAMEHGNGMERSKRVDVRLAAEADEWIVRILDDGPGCRLRDEPQPGCRPGEWNPRDGGKPRGWGMYFMAAFADALHAGKDERGRFYVQCHFRRADNRRRDV